MVRKQTKNAEEARWVLHTVGDSRFGDYFKPTFFL